MEEREEEADRLLDTIEDKEEIDTMINVAYMYINVNKPDKAMAWLKPGLGKYEDDEPFLGVLADAYYGVGELEKATDTYNALIDKNPYSAVYWFGLARCYFDSQKYDNNNGGGGGGSGSSGRRHTSRWDQDSKPEYPRAETSRSTPYERESTTYSSGQTARQSRSHSRSLSRGRSLSKEPAISMDGSPSRGNSPMRGRSRTRKGDSGSSSDN